MRYLVLVTVLLLLISPAMAQQYAYPASDFSCSWDETTGTSYYTEIDEVTASATDYIQEDDDDTCTMTLTSLTDPVSSADHTLRCWAYRSGTKVVGFTMALYQDTTEIATSTMNTPTSGTQAEFTLTLSGTEADSITNYALLRIQLLATGVSPSNCYITQCEFEVPAVAGAGRSRRTF